jgi:hypothetical protein
MGSILQPHLGWPHILLMAAGLVVAYEVGYRIARPRRQETREVDKSQADVAVAALLALLGLLLAFSFQLGAERFDKRKSLVLEESNAITTTYLRATLVRAPYDHRIQQLLREYVEALLAIGMLGIRAGLDRVRGLVSATVLLASVMCVMALIASLDQPMSGLFSISKHATEETQRILTSKQPGMTTARAEPR